MTFFDTCIDEKFIIMAINNISNYDTVAMAKKIKITANFT